MLLNREQCQGSIWTAPGSVGTCCYMCHQMQQRQHVSGTPGSTGTCYWRESNLNKCSRGSMWTAPGSICTCCWTKSWAARYNSWLLIKLMPKGEVSCFLFFSFLFYMLLNKQQCQHRQHVGSTPGSIGTCCWRQGNPPHPRSSASPPQNHPAKDTTNSLSGMHWRSNTSPKCRNTLLQSSDVPEFKFPV